MQYIKLQMLVKLHLHNLSIINKIESNSVTNKYNTRILY